MSIDDENDCIKNWAITGIIFLFLIAVAVTVYFISMILTTDRTELLKNKYEYIVESLKVLGLFISGGAVIVNVYFAGRRAEAMEETAKATNRNADAANKNAEAANRNADAANKNAETANEKQITERFAKAIEQLASEKIEVRLGTIYTLERIAKDSEKDQWTIMEVLTAFVRENAPVKKEDKSQNKKSFIDEFLNTQNNKETEELPKLRLDIQECLTVIGRREHPDPENKRLDLSNVNIRKANLQQAKLQGANLTEANLEGANLIRAELERANLTEANLTEADLTKAYLTKADLREADLTGANLAGANLAEANLAEANLAEANLTGANLREAYLEEANLTGANLMIANLTEWFCEA